MIKYFYILLILGFSTFSTSLFAQKDVLIQGKLESCEADSLRLFILDGVSLRQVAVVPIIVQENEKMFSFTVNKIPMGFYFLGLGQRDNTLPVMLGQEDQIYLEGICESFAKARIGNSPMHMTFQQSNQKLDAWQKELNRLNGEYRVATRAKRDLSPIHAQMQKLDQLKAGLLDSLKDTNPYLAKVIALRTYLGFQTSGEAYRGEAEYFAEKFFQFVELADPAYNRIPQFHDAFISYARTLGSVGFPHLTQIAYADELLEQIPRPSSAHKAALLGLVSGFERGNEDAFAKYFLQYQEYYPQDNPAISQQLGKKLRQIKHRLVGAIAPEISLPNPEGDTINISDFRGKYVLLDFWAAWCGPCRQENPNVRRMYAVYKDKGFEILGISLDRNLSSWKGAIEKDQLPWPQMSDLKQWGSIASKTYGVHAIPHTVIIGPDGKILDKNLRGYYLEKELEKLLITDKSE